MNPIVDITTTWMGAALMRQKDHLYLTHEAADRLGIHADGVLDLISSGELAAVTFMDDDRWLVELDSLDRIARRPRRQDARPDGRVWRQAAYSLQFLQRCLDAIFLSLVERGSFGRSERRRKR